MVRMLSKELKAKNYNVKSYIESDYTNPIDFYCTAYLTLEEYKRLCNEYKSSIDLIRDNMVILKDARLVRYYNKDMPLFDEPLLSEFSNREFCYKPTHLVSLIEYTAIYTELWKKFASTLDGSYDYIIFDGSLFHHPINDMIRNYNISAEQAIVHIKALLNALGVIEWQIFYLKTYNIAGQLARAYIERGQNVPTNEQIKFWHTRYKKDVIVLNNINGNYQILDISNNSWDLAKKEILKYIINNCEKSQK